MDKQTVIKDMTEAADRMGLELADLQEMINEVLQDCLTKSETIKKAISDGDATTVKAVAHDIKGSTANYGLLSASALALKIEKGADSLPQAEANELQAQLSELNGLGLDS